MLLVVILFIGFFGAGDMVEGASNLQNSETVLMHSIAGTSWNELKTASPAAANLIDWKFKSEGASLFTLALLTMATCLGGVRRGQRWAWYALCAMPLWPVLGATNILVTIRHPEYGTPMPIISWAIFFVVWVTMLGLSFRKFFRLPHNSKNGG